MLLILYGPIAEMGLKSREYLIGSGFQLVEKYNYAVAPLLTTQYGTRNYVSREEFLENTDSLFRYEVAGIQVGFNHQQISDAVCDKTNSLMTLSTKDISFLAEIKRVYADKVFIVYTYIDDSTLRGIIAGLKGISEQEAKARFQTGLEVKQSYLQYRQIFDYVVMYGGEDSVFNYQNLYRQFDSIVAPMLFKHEAQVQYGDVFISAAGKDSALYNRMRSALEQKGISVFDYSQESKPLEYEDMTANAILNARVVMPIITENALSSVWVKKEIEFALLNAEKNGTMILPVISRDVDIKKVCDLSMMLASTNCAVIYDGDEEACAEKVSNKLYKLMSAEANLSAYAKQVENYICLKMYGQAKYWQEAHLALCDEVYGAFNGALIDFEACMLSRIKLISILLDMQLHTDALEQAIEALNCLDQWDGYDVLVEQFALCCAYLDMDEDAVRKLASERLSAIGMCISGGLSERRAQEYMKTILERFQNALHTVEQSQKTEPTEVQNQTDDEDKIAQYGELVIALFENIIQDQSKAVSRQDLISGYERILNYCKHVGLKGEVADKCISRIAQLSALEETSETSQSSLQTEALKIYLGQVLPQSGEYDVFLSYKSEDEALAKKVYDYLTQSGKEVFFAKKTLPQLGESEYEEMIFEAIDRSRHMILIGSNPDYLKTSWVKDEWSTFNNEIREGRKDGNLLLLLTDDIAADKGRLPGQLRQKEIVKMSEFRNRLLPYLR